MRTNLLTLIVAIVFISSFAGASSLLAQEAKKPWWSKASDSSGPKVEAKTETAEAKTGGLMVDSPFAKINWPKLKMPALPNLKLPKMKPLWSSKAGAKGKTGGFQNPLTPLGKSISNGAKTFSLGTKNAFAKAVRVFNQDEKAPQQLAQRKASKPSFFEKLFGAKEKRRQSETVAEFMDQKRPSVR